MLKKLAIKIKLHYLGKWANQFGFHLVQIKSVDGIEYVVDGHGSWRRLAS